MSIKQIAAVLTGFLVCATAYSAPLTPMQQSAKERGIMLYNQYKNPEPELRIAAEAGDKEAQYYLAEELRQSNQHTTLEAYKWYTAAAEQGDLYAMRRLSLLEDDLCASMGNCPKGSKSPSDWKKILITTAQPLAEAGNGEAMFIMYHVSNDLEWLVKADEAHYAYGQYLLANLYDNGNGFFLLPWERNEKIEDLVKKSAEGGYAVSMGWHAYNLASRGLLKEARHWLKEAAKAGFVGIFSDYAIFKSKPENRYEIPVNLIESYGLLSLLLELDGGGDMLPLAEKELPKIASQMTSEQIEQAKIFATDWKATHSPLSYFPDKLGF
ncbi:sel1 repeat family protein [Pseudomonas sp. J452]|uniref:tetratricopeptide repeat protein n=1 Tax=Pseudomonas sp. J452 TaxID=2898441 RepID=UPI0021ADACCA|nr:sel1 repeat family protein [Pseudomonas sp. J452]UUY09554.1 sel1 repeat family protein [Pseudomonas sp. J452]